MEESEEAGGDAFYDRVYTAERPELFFKATPHRVVGHRQKIRIRSDSGWSVPEPELTLALSSHGRIFGCTIGNDVSSRDIEGENPLYLPQAKVYDGCCALGPCLWFGDPFSGSTEIHLEIRRGKDVVFRGSTSLSKLKRSPQGLVDYLFRDNSFPKGCFLMTGTGVVPPDSVALRSGDEVRIEIEPIGTLINEVA
jgi:2-dehydro-3-deoxy-D-arabinonate dehydratase